MLNGRLKSTGVFEPKERPWTLLASFLNLLKPSLLADPSCPYRRSPAILCFLFFKGDQLLVAYKTRKALIVVL